MILLFQVLTSCQGTYHFLFKLLSTIILYHNIIDDTEESDLHYRTDKQHCCRAPNRGGEWHYPNNYNEYGCKKSKCSTFKTSRESTTRRTLTFWCEILTQHNGNPTIFVNIGMSSKCSLLLFDTVFKFY